MSISGVLTTIINGFFTLLQILLGGAIIAVPLLTMRKPPEQTKKLLMLLTIGAAGILAVSGFVSSITQIITLSSIGGFTAVNFLTMLLSLFLNLIGIVLALAFPLLVHMLKKTIQPLVFLLAIPAIQAIIVIINSATGFASTLPYGAGVIVPGILCGLLLITALVLFTVWYLGFSSNRTFTLIVIIALPVVFVLCFILSMVGSAQLSAFIGISAGILSTMNFRALIFSNPMCMLLLLLFAMTVREFGIQTSIPTRPHYPGPYYPQN